MSTRNLIVACIIGLVAVIALSGVSVLVYISIAPGIIQERVYREAITLFENGDYVAAKTAFENLGEFSDAPLRVKECQNHLDYQEAELLLSSRKYDKALRLFSSLAAIEFLDSKDKTSQCQYALAMSDFEAGNLEQAFYGFQMLGNYSDAVSRAESCLAAYPEQGVLYRNPGYGSTLVTLLIDATASELPFYLKLFNNDTHVASLFIHPGGESTIKLPAGTYTIKEAYGEHWFGDDLLFGSKGFYGIMLFENDSESVHFERFYEYTLRLFSSSSGNVGNKPTDKDSFVG
ncbi:MAG: hypothetical protein FWD43_00280 [Coriobacteriia bacterium]|nr:hypothetical protein [Coriobacteriia bacterium]